MGIPARARADPDGAHRPRRRAARPLPREERDLAALAFEAEGRTWTLAEALDATYTDGFLVIHRGRIVSEIYRNGLTPAGTHLLMSVSKSITATTAGILAGRGLLDPESLVTAVLPELAGTAWEGATVRHLLDMRAGTRFNEEYADPTSDVRVYEQIYLWRPRVDAGLPEDAWTYMAGLRERPPPRRRVRLPLRSSRTCSDGWSSGAEAPASPRSSRARCGGRWAPSSTRR